MMVNVEKNKICMINNLLNNSIFIKFVNFFSINVLLLANLSNTINFNIFFIDKELQENELF